MKNTRRFLVSLLVSTMMTSPALAAGSKLKLRVFHKGGAQANFTLRSTQTMFTDLTSQIGAAPDNAFTVTVAGPVSMQVWPAQQQTNGETRVWYKRELMNFLTAVTSGASDSSNAGTWTLNYNSGPNESGVPVTKIVRFAVDNDPDVIRYSIGSRTRAQNGGFPLANLPGLAANKSITSNPGGCFAITNNGLYVAWGGTQNSLTRTCNTPTVGLEAYTITISDSVLGQTWTVIWDVNANELNVAPDGAAAGFDQVANMFAQTRYCGDYVLFESGTYVGFPTDGTGLQIAAPSVNPLTSQPCPTQPYGVGVDPGGLMLDGWYPDDTAHAGWMTLRSREYLGATITAGRLSTTATALPNGNKPFYLRFSNFNFPSSGFLGNPSVQGIGVVTGTAPSWFMADHNSAASFAITPNRNYATEFFVNDNFVVGNISVLGQDSQMVGNWGRNQVDDFLNPGFFNSTVGVEKSLVAWNFAYDKKGSANAHPDYVQFSLTNNGTGAYDVIPAGTTVEIAPVIGNIFTRANGYQLTGSEGNWAGQSVTMANAGNSVEDAHGLFLDSLVRADLLNKWYILGNVQVSTSFYGVTTTTLASGSYVAHNLVSYDFGITACVVAGTWPSGCYTNGPFKLGLATSNPSFNSIRNANGGSMAGISATYNVFTGGQDYGFTDPTNLITVLNVSTMTDANARWANPGLGVGASGNLGAVIAAWTPVTNGPIWPMGQAKPAGPFGDTSMIDFRRRRYDFSKLIAP